MMLSDVQHEFADMDDVNQEMAASFERLKEELPDMEIPEIYTQIGSFDPIRWELVWINIWALTILSMCHIIQKNSVS